VLGFTIFLPSYSSDNGPKSPLTGTWHPFLESIPFNLVIGCALNVMWKHFQLFMMCLKAFLKSLLNHFNLSRLWSYLNHNLTHIDATCFWKSKKMRWMERSQKWYYMKVPNWIDDQIAKGKRFGGKNGGFIHIEKCKVCFFIENKRTDYRLLMGYLNKTLRV